MTPAALTTLFAALSLLAPAPGEALPPVETHLVIVGGGERPPLALGRFVEWAGGPSSRLLVVTWASGEPAESCEAMLEELRSHGPGDALCAPRAALDAEGRAQPLGPAQKAEALYRLGRATGIFFTGGDQGRIMDVLADEDLLRAVVARFRVGVAVGGTSAGAAILSPLMITGEGDFSVIDGDQVEVRAGLGLLPGVIVDQHFVKRQRENRLFGLVLEHPELRGVGIDEDTALLVIGGRRGEVVGRGPVVLVDAHGPDRLLVTLVRAGETVDLTQRP